MSGDDCVNCGAADAERFDVQVRNTRHRAVALCATCHASIRRELDEGR